MNEIPKRISYHIQWADFTIPAIGTSKRPPIPTDAEDDIPVVDAVSKNFFAHKPSSHFPPEICLDSPAEFEPSKISILLNILL
jgi:hypothetical protein